MVGSETTMDVEFVRVLQEVVVAYFMALCQSIHRGTEKMTQNRQVSHFMSGLVGVRSSNTCSATFGVFIVKTSL
jgi:hypothetical protein